MTLPLPETVKFSPAVPYAFTEQGVSMLSSILRSKIAVQTNIAIMRAFVLMRQMIISYEELLDALKNWKQVPMLNFRNYIRR